MLPRFFLYMLRPLAESDIVPLVSMLQLLASATFQEDIPFIFELRAELQRRVSYVVGSVHAALRSGVFCPCLNRRLPGCLRFEAFCANTFEEHLERRYQLAPYGLRAYDADDPYPKQLLERWQEYNAAADSFAGVLGLLAEVHDASCHWLWARWSGRELFIVRFAYKNFVAALVFEDRSAGAAPTIVVH